MKIIVHTLALDSKEGTESFSFPTEKERDDYLFNWACQNCWDADELERAQQDYESGDLDLHEFVQEHSDYLDTFSTDYHVLDVSLWSIIAETFDHYRWQFVYWKRHIRKAWGKA